MNCCAGGPTRFIFSFPTRASSASQRSAGILQTKFPYDRKHHHSVSGLLQKGEPKFVPTIVLVLETCSCLKSFSKVLSPRL